jgi:hypothetical protein
MELFIINKKMSFKPIVGIFSIFILISLQSGMTQNPIVPNVGLNDPHIHIFNDTAYVYASHDKSAENQKFIMEDWWIWSSPDLVNWEKRCVLKPEDTFIGKPFSGCWATDAAYRNGKYYWYLSEKNQQAGVVVGETPVGPWTDPLGKPLLTSELTPTDEYDMAIFEENGEHFIIFGVWDYYIAKLNDDMISLAEKPKRIIIHNEEGPYGKGTTDDKPFVHTYNGKYYLSWGCFYAMSDDLYGPYDYKGTVIKQESFAKGYDAPTWPNGFLQGRHGSFFEWHNQWYYIYCDISQTGNRWFRDSFMSYVHYRGNGEMALIRVDGIGVGRYLADQPIIEAEDYFANEGFSKKQISRNNFGMVPYNDNAFLYFPNIDGLKKMEGIAIKASCQNSNGAKVIIYDNDKFENPISSIDIPFSNGKNDFDLIYTAFDKKINHDKIWIKVETSDPENLLIDSFSFH